MTNTELETAALRGELEALHELSREVLHVWIKLRPNALLDLDVTLKDLDVMRRLQFAVQRRQARRSITPPGAHGPDV